MLVDHKVTTTNPYTLETRHNEPWYDEVPAIVNSIHQPGQSYSKMYRAEPWYHEPRYNEIPDISHITNTIHWPKLKMSLIEKIISQTPISNEDFGSFAKLVRTGFLFITNAYIALSRFQCINSVPGYAVTEPI